MKAAQFIKILRQVVREEVRTVVKEELKTLKPLISEVKQPTPRKQTQPAKAPRIPTVSLEGPLGDILRETAESFYHQPQQEEWSELGGGTFTSETIEDTQAYHNEAPLMGSMSGDPTAMFVKDYSKVMRAADNYQKGNN